MQRKMSSSNHIESLLDNRHEYVLSQGAQTCGLSCLFRHEITYGSSSSSSMLVGAAKEPTVLPANGSAGDRLLQATAASSGLKTKYVISSLPGVCPTRARSCRVSNHSSYHGPTRLLHASACVCVCVCVCVSVCLSVCLSVCTCVSACQSS